jgi:hypothetical protein
MGHEEVIQILTEMHDDCSERIDCDGCKFLAINNTCALRMIPAEWRLDLLDGRTSKGERRK